MLTQTTVSSPERVRPWRPGIWRVQIPRGRRVMAGVTDRHADLDTLRARLPTRWHLILAEQIHGASVAAIETPPSSSDPIPGCDGLITRLPGLALVMRTADCLPILLWDPVQQVVGAAHVGWRGLDKQLPMRLVQWAQACYQSRPEDLWVSIGPAIRSCCYEVGRDFVPRFGPFVQEAAGRVTCDLIGCASRQLVSTGVRPTHVVDSGLCTACDAQRCTRSVENPRPRGGCFHSLRCVLKRVISDQ